MARFQRLEPDAFPPEAQDLVQRVTKVSADGVGGPFNLMLRSPPMARRLMALLDYFNDETEVLEPLTRRLAVLILARRASARYAWWTHRRRALAMGQFDATTVDALNRGEKPAALSPRLSAVFDFVIAMTGTGASDSAFAALRQHLDEAEVVELIGLCGTYTTIAYLLNEGGVLLPEGETDTLLPLAAPFAGPGA